MADIRRFPRWSSRLRTVEDVPTSDISLVVAALLEEQEKRPELVEKLGRFPVILSEYLGASEYTKERLAEFDYENTDYLLGDGQGVCIRSFSTQQEIRAELLARKCRYASQLVELFDFYVENGMGKRFTQHYMMYDEQLRAKKDMVGLQLVKAVQKQFSLLRMDDVVDIVAEVRPMIREFYCAPEQQYQTFRNVAFVDFGKK